MVKEWALQYFQEAKPARQAREIAYEQAALRHPFCRGLVAETESSDASRGIREGLVRFRRKQIDEVFHAHSFEQRSADLFFRSAAFCGGHLKNRGPWRTGPRYPGSHACGAPFAYINPNARATRVRVILWGERRRVPLSPPVPFSPAPPTLFG